MTTKLKLAKSCWFGIASMIMLGACNAMHNAPTVSAVGHYALVSVDGKPVPADVSHDGAKLEVRSGSFTIDADGTCRTTTVFVPPTGREVAREVSATYTQEGATLTMRWKGAGMTIGSVEGSTFTMNNEGMLFVYTK